MHQAINEIRTANPGSIQSVADSWFLCALAERDASTAQLALTTLGEDNPFGVDAIQLDHNFGEGLIGRMTNDPAKARAGFSAARIAQERRIQAQPDYGPAYCILGLIDAGLGRKEEALREGRRAIELLPVEKDSVNGPHMIEYFAIIASWVGEKDLAFEKLDQAIHMPAEVSYGRLKLLPYYDPLRGDLRFEKIVNSLAPK